MQNYSSENTALLIVDPFTDFLSEGDKLWSFTKETGKGVNLIENLKKYYQPQDPRVLKLYMFLIVIIKNETSRAGNFGHLHMRDL
jgi:hypothetical protein